MRSYLKHVHDIKVISNEECLTQHKLIVADITVDGHSPEPRILPPRRRVWEVGDPTVCKDYETLGNEECTEPFSNEKPVDGIDPWKTFLLNGVDQVCLLMESVPRID